MTGLITLVVTDVGAVRATIIVVHVAVVDDADDPCVHRLGIELEALTMRRNPRHHSAREAGDERLSDVRALEDADLSAARDKIPAPRGRD